MTIEIKDLQTMRRNLNRFLARFDDCVKTRPSRRHLATYVGGQVSDLERKSVEPIALAADVQPRTLQKFLATHLWDEEAVSRRQREILMKDHADENAVAVIDETSFAKKGDKTPAVQRQYCGCTGKKDNCVLSVHLAYATPRMQALVDEDIFLPEHAWDADRDRCREAGIPDDVRHRPKWRIALEILERSIAAGMRFRYLTADEAYGGCGEFRRSVGAMELTYVVEVPRTTYVWTTKPKVEEPSAYAGEGRPRVRARLAEGEAPAMRVDELWPRGGPSWQAYHIKDTERGPVVWEVRAKRVWVSENSLPSEEAWLLVARNSLDGEVKYFLSNASPQTSPEAMLKVAFTRWVVERLFEDAKGEVGLDHFEVRTYLGLKRHLILSRVSLHFLQRETNRRRGEKSVVESGADSPRGGGAVGSTSVAA
jgi:SRSO17 transposase